MAGEQRGHVAVRSDAEHHDLERAAALGPELAAVRVGGLGDGREVVGRADLVDPGGVDADRVEERGPGCAGVAVGGVAGDEALVTPPEVDARPVDAAESAEAIRASS